MTETTVPSTGSDAERADLIVMLERHRGFLLTTVQGLTNEQARLTPTVSALSLGGLIKHVTATEVNWLDFIDSEPAAAGEASSDQDQGPDSAAYEAYANMFRLLPEETLDGVLAEYQAVATRAESLARTVDLAQVHPLPPAPWFEPGASWSNRRVFMHIVAETSQHAGHADIIRETIDGQKTMG